MRQSIRLLVIAGALASLLSCDPLLSGSLPSGMVDSTLVQHVPYTGSFTYTVNPGTTPRDVYFVFTNPSLSQNAPAIPSVSSSVSVDGFALPAPAAQPLPSRDTAPLSLTDRIAEFNRSASPLTIAAPTTSPSGATVSVPGAAADKADVSVGTWGLDLDSSYNAVNTVNATCRLVVGPVTFSDGRTRTLSIWVDNSDWTTEITLEMLNDIAARFLNSPETQADIYHWDTAVVGEPWGAQSYSNLIQWDARNTITILLTHLNSSYGSGAVTVGYFYAKDNFTQSYIPGSNQRIMFYLDSKLYSTLNGSETGYLATNYWPKIIFSTLAHEFQHMIQFYQKQVSRGASSGTDTWINEMCSMIMEDLVADKLSVEGPRGVMTGDAGSAGNGLGRFPDFNASSNASLAMTAGGSNFGLTQYAVAYAFGAWLARNYGGPALLKAIVQSSATDSSAVATAAAAYSGRNESMDRLLQRWAASVLLSDTTTAPPGYRYNTGGWSAFTQGAESFNLGSINDFNYSPQLTTYSAGSAIPVAPYYSSNVYFLAASKLSSARTFSVTIPAGVEMSVVLK